MGTSRNNPSDAEKDAILFQRLQALKAPLKQSEKVVSKNASLSQRYVLLAEKILNAVTKPNIPLKKHQKYFAILKKIKSKLNQKQT